MSRGAAKHDNDGTAVSILFVCLGNICRSPLAEAIAVHAASQRGMSDRLIADSAGTSGHHEGSPADRRSIAVAKSRGIAVTSRSRPIVRADRGRWDMVIAMDEQNRRDLLAFGFAADRVSLLRHYDPSAAELDIPDPYYGGSDDFERVFDMTERACSGLLDLIFTDMPR